MPRLLTAVRPRFTTASDSSPARLTIVALVSEDNDRRLLAGICRANRWDVYFADTCENALEMANLLESPVILCDRDLPGAGWRANLHALASSPHGACVILISSVLDKYLWNDVGLNGGYDVLSKPLQEDDAVRAIKLACAYWKSSARV